MAANASALRARHKPIFNFEIAHANKGVNDGLWHTMKMSDRVSCPLTRRWLT